MGFLKNLFEKKICDICGEEIGLLGNRKLEDGNCCKTCARKLSPWFTERRSSTVEEIKQQLAGREANRQAVLAFRESRVLGEDMKVLLDEDAGKFMVTRGRDLQEENPDVLDFRQVTACHLNVDESRTEVYKQGKDSEGNPRKESYSPRRYKYGYDFQVTILVNHPYIEEIKFNLNRTRIPVTVQDRENFSSLFLHREDREGEGSVNPPSARDCRENPHYAQCEKWAQELERILLHTQPKPGAKIMGLIEKYENIEKKAAEALASHNEMAYAGAQRQKLQAMRAMQDAYREDPRPEVADRVAEVLKRYQTEPKLQVEKTVATRYCTQCGAPLTEGKYCIECGAPVSE